MIKITPDSDMASQTAVPISTLLAQLQEDGRQWIESEVEFYKLSARQRLIAVAVAAALFTIALAIILGMVMVVQIESVIVLSDRWGRVGGLCATIAGSLMLAAIIALFGRARLNAAIRRNVDR